jgi:hypothetical protein
MYALNPDISISETTLTAGCRRNHQVASRRELEFQSALENYLSDYRPTMDANKCQARSARNSAFHRFVEWYRRQVTNNHENTSYLYNYGQQERNDCVPRFECWKRGSGRTLVRATAKIQNLWTTSIFIFRNKSLICNSAGFGAAFG